MANKPGQADILVSTPDGSPRAWVDVTTDGIELATPSVKLSVSESAGGAFLNGYSLNGSQTSFVAASGDTTGVQDQANIQAALTKAHSNGGGTVVLFGGALSGGHGSTFYVGGGPAQANGAALAQYSNTTVIIWDATLFLVANAGMPALMNANPVSIGARTDTNLAVIGIGRAVLDGNAANNPHVVDASFLTIWKSIPWFYCGVTGFVWRDLTQLNPSALGFGTQNCTDWKFLNITSSCDATTANQSPISVYGFNKNFVIDGVYGNSADDAVPLVTFGNGTGTGTDPSIGAFIYPTADGHLPGGDITDFSIDHVVGSWGQANTGNIVRFLNGDGNKIQRGTVGMLRGSGAPSAAICFGQSTYAKVAPSLGDLAQINIVGPVVGSGSIAFLRISQAIQSVQIANLMDTGVSNFIFTDAGLVFTADRLTVSNVRGPGNKNTQAVVNTQAGATFTNFEARAWNFKQAKYLFNNGGAMGGIFENLYIDVVSSSGGSVFNSSPAITGWMDDVRVGSWVGTRHVYVATGSGCRLGPNMPQLTSGDVAPTAVLGSQALCDKTRILQTGLAADLVGTPTVTIASPGVFSLTAHGLVAGDAVYLETTGALPTGLTADTTYFVIATGLTADAFELSASVGGSAINTSGSQSGTHSLYRAKPAAYIADGTVWNRIVALAH